MPQRTIYIPDDLVHILDKAQKEFGEGEGLGSLMVKALKEKLDNLPQVKEEVLKLHLLQQCDVRILNELIEYKLREYPEKIVNEAAFKAELAFQTNPDHFSIFRENYILLHEVIWAGDAIDLAILGLEELETGDWFEEAKKMIEIGAEQYKEEMENLGELFEKEGLDKNDFFQNISEEGKKILKNKDKKTNGK